MIVNEHIEIFLSSIDRSDSTLRHYRRLIEYWRDATDFRGRSMDDIKPADIVLYMQNLRKRGLSPATCDNYLAPVRVMFSWLSDRGITGNPTIGISRRRKRTGGQYVRLSLAPDQVADLLETLNEDSVVTARNSAMIQLMVFTALRCIEVSRLNNSDLKHASDHWFLSVMRKGSTDKDSRILVPDSVAVPINRYLAMKDDADIAEGPLFANHGHNGMGKRMKPAYISKIIKRHLKRIGLSGRQWSAHSLRHTAACLASTAGSEIEEIQLMLGHSSMAMTTLYLRSLGLRTGTEDAAIQKIDDYWKKFKRT